MIFFHFYFHYVNKLLVFFIKFINQREIQPLKYLFVSRTNNSIKKWPSLLLTQF